MKIQIISGGNSRHEALLKKKIAARIPAEFGSEGMKIALKIDSAAGEAESYRIEGGGESWVITGSDGLGLFFGIGKFLHSARWTESDFAPNPPAGVIAPNSPFRCIYFAVHFYNWYQNAPTEELENYLEDLLLWGFNTAFAVIPTVNMESFEEELFFRSADKVKRLFRMAKDLGMSTGFGLSGNKGLKSAPHELDADLSFDPYGKRGTIGRLLCLSKPGTAEYMKDMYRNLLKPFADVGIDYVSVWPYDEGGCGCKDCRPWGGNKYLEGCKNVREVTLEFFPEAKFIVSTWLFDTPEDEGEYEALYRRLKGDMSWVDYLMTDAHADFPRYPLEHEPVKPIVNFPEISMWKLYPWGGYGANPMPERFQGFWDSAKHILKGGMPYSEGIYEDISKIQCVGYYWDPDRNWRDTLGEYLSYEVDASVAADALEMIQCIEKNHVAVGNSVEPDPAAARRAGELARKIDAAVPPRAKSAWRWRILYIRAILDEKRYAFYFSHNMKGADDLWLLYHFSGSFLARDSEAQSLFKELRDRYHCVEVNGENVWTLPPLKGSTVIG